MKRTTVNVYVDKNGYARNVCDACLLAKEVSDGDTI